MARRTADSDRTEPTTAQAAHIARRIDTPEVPVTGAAKGVNHRCYLAGWIDRDGSVTDAGYAAVGREVPAEPVPDPTCDHRTGQVGCALPTCQGVPVGVDVHTEETVAAEPVGYESGHAASGRDLTHAMRRTGLVVTLPTTFESRWDRGNVRKISGYDMTANGHAVRVLSYESRGSLSTCGMPYAAVYVDGQLISSEQPMWGGAAKFGHAIAYAVACHVDTLRAAKVAAERAEVPAPAEVAEPVAEVADFSGTVRLADVAEKIGAEVPEVPAEPVAAEPEGADVAEPVRGQRRGYGQRVSRTVTNRRADTCDWCGQVVPAGQGEARLLDVGGWVVVHPDSRWHGSPVSGGYVGGCPTSDAAEPVAVASAEPEPVADNLPAEPVAEGAEVPADAEPVDRSAVVADMWTRARTAWDGGNLADALTMVDAAEGYAPDHYVSGYGTWAEIRSAMLAASAEPVAEPVDAEVPTPAEPDSVPEPVAEVPAEPEPVRTPLVATVDRDSLADALAFVAKSIARRPTVPVLSGVVLSAEGGRVTVAAFDYETSRAADVPADDVTAGRAVVEHKRFAEVVKKLPRRTRVSLADTGSAVEVVCGRVRLSLPTMPAEDYPTLPPMPAEVGRIGAQYLADAVAAVAVAAGTDETMPALTGVRWEAADGTLAMFTTDRYRLGVREVPWTGDAFAALMPARNLADVAKRYGKIKGGRVSIGHTGTDYDGLISLACGPYRATARTLDGSNFPKIRSLVPTSHGWEAVVTVADMVGAVERAGMACERTQPVRLSFAGGEVTVIGGGGGDSAEVAEPVGCEWSGGTLTAGFQPAYLIDGLKSAGTDRTRIRFVDAQKPALILPTGKGVYGPSDLYLIMPVRGDWAESSDGIRPEAAKPAKRGKRAEVAEPVATAEPVAEVAAEPEPVAPVAEVAAEPEPVAPVAEVAAEPEPVADSVPEVPAERAEPEAVAEVAEVPADAATVAEPGADIMARAVDAYAAGDLAGALAAVAEGEMVAPAYRSAGASGTAYGWAEMRASLPAEPVAPVAEPAEPAEVAAEPEPVAEVVPVADVAEPVAEPVRPEVPAEPEPVAASAVDVHAAILAQLGRAGSVAPSLPAPVRVAVPDTAAAVVAGWRASDLPVPVSPAPAPVAEPVPAGEGAEPVAAGPVPAWTYAAGMRVRTILKEVRPEVARRMRDGGVKVGRVSIVPDRDARAVAVTLDGVAEGDAPGVWAIVAEVMGGHGFTAAEVAAEV